MEKIMIILMGISHLLVSFTSLTVVTSVLGFNLPLAFLFAGIGTLIFHIATKNKLPMVLGVSGLYIGSLLYVTQNFGIEYAMGGIVVAGIIYVLFALIMFKWQDKILKFFPDWLLSTVVLLIGLNLLPIGRDLMLSNLLVGLVAFGITALIDLFGGKKLGMFAMPLGVLAGTVTMALTNGLDYSVLSQTVSMEFITPKFALAPILSIAPLTLAVMFETLGDTKNNSDIIGMDIFKEVGLGRILLGNGLATIAGGSFGANVYTTYSENNAFIMLSKYYNPMAQIVTAFLMIAVAFVPAITKGVMLIPSEAMGGVVAYLFAMIAVNAIKQIVSSGVNLANNKRVFVIITVMISLSSLTYVIGGISISSVAIATLVGTVLNALVPSKE